VINTSEKASKVAFIGLKLSLKKHEGDRTVDLRIETL
jgi:hypothetical protein